VLGQWRVLPATRHFRYCRSNRNESSVAGSVTILASASICSSSISSGSSPSFRASSAVKRSVVASNESPRYDSGLMTPAVKSCCADVSPNAEHATIQHSPYTLPSILLINIFTTLQTYPQFQISIQQTDCQFYENKLFFNMLISVIYTQYFAMNVYAALLT